MDQATFPFLFVVVEKRVCELPLAENRLLTDSIKAGSATPIGGQSTINRLHKMANSSSPDPFSATRNKMEKVV